MKILRMLLAAAMASLLCHFELVAKVPHLISYQGRVTAHGTNFSGVGRFKFALVDGGSNMTAQATATATVVNGFLVAATVNNPGAGYDSAPSVTIADPTGLGARLLANLANGRVASIEVLDAGFGYSAPVLTIAPPNSLVSFRTYWSNDGSSFDGSEPMSAISLPVSQGLFSLLLGDTNLLGMLPIPPSVFTNEDVRLRIWFDGGTGIAQLLSPDQRFVAVGFAMMAESVADGAITAAKLAPGAVGAMQLADGAVTAAKLATNAGITVPSGSVVLATDAEAASLLAAGYVRLPESIINTDGWEIIPARDPIPAAYSGASVVSSGGEAIVWGGTANRTGGRYVFASNLWIHTTSVGAPQPRESHSAVWAGGRMIVWGGNSFPEGQNLNSGGIYDRSTDSWTPVTETEAPLARFGHLAVWSGSEMLIWGGVQSAGGSLLYLNTGARFNPALNRWFQMSTSNAPSPRLDPFAAWTGSELLVWGGITPNFASGASGARYNPTTDTWTPISPFMPVLGGELAPRLDGRTLGLWTGSEMVLWPGQGLVGARYSPSSGTWRQMNPYCTTVAGQAIWTGTKGIWIPIGLTAPFPLGFYDVNGDSWSFSLEGNVPWIESRGVPIWSGTSILFINPNEPERVAKYTPSRPLYLFRKP